jgi:cytochrome c peroxidase
MRFIFLLALIALVPLAASSPAVAEDEYPMHVPLGLDVDVLFVPEDNPITTEKIELGKLLYFDPRLSVDGTVSCASCHDPSLGWTDQKQFSAGVEGKLGGRNSPTVINTAFNYFQFWDGRAKTLEEQATGPIENPVEMANTLEAATATIASIEGYKSYFKAAFGDEAVSIERIAMAIATFERTVLSGNSPWDRYALGGDEDAMSESAIRGLELFEGKANCSRCHIGFNLTDNLFHNIGVGMAAEKPDLGRFDVTKEEADRGWFKTPTLRDITRTAPYMHDGSVETLEEVMEFYVGGGEENPWLDTKNMEILDLSDEEIADVIEFMKHLDGDWKPMSPPVLPE